MDLIYDRSDYDHMMYLNDENMIQVVLIQQILLG